jgi:hypothetical protein
MVICVVFGSKNFSTYSREYASGYSRPAAAQLIVSPSPRDEGKAGQAPWGKRI